MKIRRKTQLHVVRDDEEMMINRLLTELDDEDNVTAEEEIKDKKSKRKKILIRTAIAGGAVLLLSVVMYFWTYTSANIVTSHQTVMESNNSYQQFAKGVLKYSRDGIAYLNRKNEEIWNHPYQIKNPMIERYKETAAVADKGGNYIAVFDEKGVKGEMQTSLPIEKVAVSKQGIICALLKNENSPKIVCYDAVGNILAELKTSFVGTGYPMDISISENGTMILVSYMSIEKGEMSTKIVYYDFSGETKANKQYEVKTDVYKGMLAPTVFFINESESVVVCDERLLLYKGTEKPEIAHDIPLEKKIKSVFYSEKYIGLILKNEGAAGYELCLYNTAGRKVMSEDFVGDYTHAKIDGGKVLMYDGKKCSVFTRTGVHRFEGELNSNILEMFPMTGINKYIVMSENGMEIVRFVK
jgi:hypothetical protein